MADLSTATMLGMRPHPAPTRGFIPDAVPLAFRPWGARLAFRPGGAQSVRSKPA
jgi:hypothetical protein